MSKIGAELAKLKIKPGDVVVVRQIEPVPQSNIIEFLQQLAAIPTVGENHVVVLPPGLDVDSLDDEGMAQMGWFRKEALPQC